MIPDRLASRYQAAREACAIRVTGQPPMTMEDQLKAIEIQARQFDSQDVYGRGALIEGFETGIANLLGKPSALFLPSGTMAQTIALRTWADRKSTRRVGFHATSHLELHEEHGYRHLYGLEAELLGEPDRVVSLADLETLQKPLAAVLLELPMREIGGQLPDWGELESQSQWARQNGVALDMDGARLWQCPPYYGRSLGEIAALFDSVYLSFYKDIGGIAGSVLAGPEDFIETARVWVRRAGGNLYSLFPYVLAAKAGLERNLDSLPQAVEDAAWLADCLNRIDGLQTFPKNPPTNLFHLLADSDPVELVEKACRWSEQHKVFLLPMPRGMKGGRCVMEFSIGQAFRAVSRDQWQAWLTDFFTAGSG